jgi:hypothetical protein
MLPHINAKDRHFAPPHYRVLIFRRYDSQPLLLSRLNLDQPSPATALDSQQRGLECVEEGLFIAPRGLDLLDELWCGGRLGLGGGSGCKVLPKQRVVNVASGIELDGGLQSHLRGDVGSVHGLGLCFQCSVEVCDILSELS